MSDMSSIIEELHESRINEAVEVDTSRWCFSNGKKVPSGVGSWWFKIGDEEKGFNGKYSDAKKQAQAYARSIAINRIYLLEKVMKPSSMSSIIEGLHESRVEEG